MAKFISISIRTLVGLFAVLIGSGAFLEAQYLTGIGGISLALLATVNPPSFTEKLKASYWFVFVGWMVIFLLLSYVDASATGFIE